jgi:hypothetical protein
MDTRKISLRISLLALLGCLAVSGCSSNGRSAPPDAGLTVVHAAPSYGTIAFLREERRESQLAYRDSVSFQFDVDLYDFNLEIVAPGATSPTRILSFDETLEVDTRHLFVLAEQGGLITPLVFKDPLFDTTSPEVEMSAMNAAATLGSIDVYVEPRGTDISTVAPFATLGLMERSALQLETPGELDVTVTEAGNVSNVLFQAPTITFGAGQTAPLVFVDGADIGTANAYMIAVGRQPPLVVDRNVGAEIRAINAASDRLPRDVYLNGDFAAPVFSAAEFGVVTEFLPIDPGAVTVQLTPEANPGTIEGEASIAATIGSRLSLLITGSPGDLTAIGTTEDLRIVSGEARVKFLNGSNNHDALEYFITLPGVDLGTVVPVATLGTPGSSIRITLAPDDYDLTVRDAASHAVVAGPLPITLGENVYTAVTLDNPDGTTVDVQLFDGFVAP